MREALTHLRNAGRTLGTLPFSVRSQALKSLAKNLITHQELLIEENKKDLTAFSGAENLRKRLLLTKEKLEELTKGILQLSEEKDPLGKTLSETLLDEGLTLKKITVPLGVVAVIFESRPDVLPQLIALALLSGNGIVLKGGSEALATNRAMMNIVREISKENNLPEGWSLLLDSREAVDKILNLHDLIDLIIPRGSNALVSSIMERSKIPVLGHADGVCHLYAHKSANIAQAVKIIVDAKTQYPAACNAVETLLLDEIIAEELLKALAVHHDKITFIACSKSHRLIPSTLAEADHDWHTEYGEPTLAVKIVSGVEEAIAHINQYGSHHTDAILGKEKTVIERFINEVDSASVMVNTSTRFADGYRYGLGAEVGISTSKIHSRGPSGVEALLSTKYVLEGTGLTVAEYSGENAKAYLHKKLL